MRRSERIGASRLGLAGGLRAVAAVVGFRLRAGWRKALSEKGKLVFGVIVGVLLATNYTFSVRAMEEAPGRGIPVDMLFGLIAFFVLLTLFQWAPLGRWFSRREGARFGLTAGRRAALTVGTNLVGLTMLLVVLNALLARVFAGAGRPRGLEWAFEGMDVVSAVIAMVAAGPLGAVILGGQGGRRWLGAGLGLALLAVLGASTVEPLWAGSSLWSGAFIHAGRLTLLAALLAVAFPLEQRSPDDGGGRATKGGRRPALAGKVETVRRWPAAGRGARADARSPSGFWSRPTFVVALAETRMMLRFRQVRLNLVFSWAMPVVMVFVFWGEELPGGGGQFALWMAVSVAAFLGVVWVAFFANLLGFTADGARRLAMSAENALLDCLPGKVLGVVSVVGSLVLAQTTVLTVLLADRIPAADRALPFLVGAISLVGLAGAGTVVSILFPRKPELHEQRDFFCSILGLVVLVAAWFIQMAVVGSVLAAARSLGGSTAAVTAMTVLLLLAAAGCGFLVAALAKGDWLRRRLREWAVTV